MSQNERASAELSLQRHARVSMADSAPALKHGRPVEPAEAVLKHGRLEELAELVLMTVEVWQGGTATHYHH